MSEPISPRLKVSREGIVLIKSFEGFRPRSVRSEDGGWVIGYGHTLSAREGASVSEADAELLLRYDLLPVEKAINETSAPLNQHQFDALVSFAHSVGLDQFSGSDVAASLAAGAASAAADAIMGWPERQRPETALRRRAAERALFVADPETAVTLSDLLAAPLPLPPAEPAEAEAVPAPALSETPSPDAAPAPAPNAPRDAAVAALLGEPEAGNDQSEPGPIIPVWTTPTVAEATPEPEASAVETSPEHDAADPALMSAEPAWPDPEISDPEAREAVPEGSRPPLEADQPAVAEDITADSTEAPEPASAFDRLTLTRYSPYGAAIVGPLPYLEPAAPREPDPLEGAIVEAAVGTGELATPADLDGQRQSDLGAAAGVDAPPTAPAPIAELILTPPDDAPEPAIARPLWEPAERDAEPRPEEGVLFGEDLALTQGTGALMRSDHEPDPPVRFDWSETGAFIIMGGVGLTAFGASMAAFRLAAEQSGGDQVTLIAWVLAVIGAACVGVSSFNLYRRLGLPGGD